jgi:hypothetical protein
MSRDAATFHQRRFLAPALAALALLLAPAAADAASARVDSGGKLTYTANSGEANRVVLTVRDGDVELVDNGTRGAFPVLIDDDDGCSGYWWRITCTDVTSVVVNGGDSGDQVDTSAVDLRTTVTTGDGDDVVVTGDGNDSVNTHDGDDVVLASLGNDTLTGGPGVDTVSYAGHGESQPVSVTLDGAQNDGCGACGEVDKVGADFESVIGGQGSDSITGNNGANTISGGGGDDQLNAGAGDDSIDGGTGADSVDGGAGNDRLAVRDATVDQLACGDGDDGGDADHDDGIAADCESVVRAEAPPVPDATTAPDGDTDGPFNLVPPRIPPQAAVVTSAGVALVRVACPADAGSCSGTVRLVLLDGPPAETAAAARRRRLPTIGRAKFAAEAGEKPLVEVRLNRRGRHRVLRSRRGNRCYARVIVTTRTAGGELIKTAQDITLRERRTARRVKRGGRGRKR